VLKLNLSTQELKLKQSKLDTESFLQKVGNGVHPSTPISQDEKENTVLRYYHPRWGGVREAASILDHDEFVKA
jgi:seryl-tRNA synthetase